jgi:tetratricopeptide (TPR) repeat protein
MMNFSDDALEGLLDAIRVSPENLPLRKHVAEMLLDLERYEEAEQQYTQALEFAPDDIELKLGLAEACLELEKLSIALVVVEEVLSMEKPPADAYYLHALICARKGEYDQARESYHVATQIDTELEDTELEAEIAFKKRPYDFDSEGSGLEDEEENMSTALLKPSIRFADLIGFEAEKRWLRGEGERVLGKKSKNSSNDRFRPDVILLHGPQGAGKSQLTQALAGEFGAYYAEISPAFLARWFDDRSDFADAWDTPAGWEPRPMVLVVDQVDTWAGDELFRSRPEYRLYIERFWNELSIIISLFPSTLLVLTSSEPWKLDQNWLSSINCRRGIPVLGPDLPARKAWFAEIDESENPEFAPRMALLTEGFTFQDLNTLRERAFQSSATLGLDALIAQAAVAGRAWKEEAAQKLKPFFLSAYDETSTLRRVDQ